MEFARTSPKSLKLILTARRIDTLREIAEEIKKEVGSGVQVLPVKLDVSNPREVKGFVDSLPAEFREIDVLVNNAQVVPMAAHGFILSANDFLLVVSLKALQRLQT